VTGSTAKNRSEKDKQDCENWKVTMSIIRKRFKKREGKTQTGRAVKRGLILLIVVLVIILLAMILGIGEAWWPVWIIQHRAQVEGIILLLIIVLILLSPLMIEATAKTRTLSGPGKNPYIDP
jgi:hypothetical protein